MEPLHQYTENDIQKKSVSVGSKSRKLKKPRFSFLKKINKKLIIYGLLILVAVFIGSKLIRPSDTVDERVEVSGAKASQEISKEFVFPLKDSDGEDVSDIKFYIDTVDLRDEIVVQGSRATSIKGRIFLIITLRISNEYDQAINMNTRDYLRLSVNGNSEEWLAPDIHNDPVEVQAISTKITRVGFPINETDRDLILRVGEIEGDKESIPLDLN